MPADATTTTPGYYRDTFQRGLCPVCKYDLVATEPDALGRRRCPECGYLRDDRDPYVDAPGARTRIGAWLITSVLGTWLVACAIPVGLFLEPVAGGYAVLGLLAAGYATTLFAGLRALGVDATDRRRTRRARRGAMIAFPIWILACAAFLTGTFTDVPDVDRTAVLVTTAIIGVAAAGAAGACTLLGWRSIAERLSRPHLAKRFRVLAWYALLAMSVFVAQAIYLTYASDSGNSSPVQGVVMLINLLVAVFAVPIALTFVLSRLHHALVPPAGAITPQPAPRSAGASARAPAPQGGSPPGAPTPD